MSESLEELVRQLAEHNTGVVDVGPRAPDPAKSDVEDMYTTLIDMSSIVSFLARQSTVQKYRQQSKQVPDTEHLDGQYYQYYSDSVSELVNDMGRLMPYWKSIENMTYNGSSSSPGITEVDRMMAETLFRDVLDDEALYNRQNFVSSFQDLIRKFANSLPGADLSGAAKMPSEAIVLKSSDLPIQPDRFNPSQLVRTPTLTMLFVRIDCVAANGQLDITTNCRALVAVLNVRKVKQDQDKLSNMVQAAADSDMGFKELRVDQS